MNIASAFLGDPGAVVSDLLHHDVGDHELTPSLRALKNQLLGRTYHRGQQVQPAIEDFDMGPLACVGKVPIVPRHEVFYLMHGCEGKVKGISKIAAWHHEVLDVNTCRQQG
jgi:hypothetical protein